MDVSCKAMCTFLYLVRARAYLHTCLIAYIFVLFFLQYIQPHEHQKLSQVELLVVDEAAAIPLPVVKSPASFHCQLWSPCWVHTWSSFHLLWMGMLLICILESFFTWNNQPPSKSWLLVCPFPTMLFVFISQKHVWCTTWV